MDTSYIPFADPLWHHQSRPSPYYNESHFRLQRELRAYVSEHISPNCAEWEAAGHIPTSVLERHASLGYSAVSIFPLAEAHHLQPTTSQLDASQLGQQRLPAGIKAEEWDAFHDLVFIDEMARCGYLGIVWGLSCGNSIGVPPLINFGTEEQKKRWLPDVLRGRVRFCLGVTEPDAGSDVANITTTAVLNAKGDAYIVDGAKKWITNAIFADYCTAAVRTGTEESGRKGVSALIIPLKAKGVTLRKLENSGVNASGSTYIEFDNVEVPVGNLLGRENAGFEIIMSNFNHERLWLACTSLRMARVCAEDAYTHSITRETFGKKLIENQVIRQKISLFGRQIDSTHALMEQLVYIALQKSDIRSLSYVGGLMANLKVQAGRTLEQVVREAQQVLGGLGYSKTGKGARIEQISRDVRVMVVGGGSEEILVDLAAREEIKAMTDLRKRARMENKL
ncbi:acyl-CoA dehydrogenase NM domain-like protein [Corynespora cassiicola Philippines]|uniref:Acyl-CoA dehydrogenase NM domain-like protein n=1 Tax=Corynespora cassiicola Philippines TaxID=1448308 RepID=A0A2T2NMN4_CORCC|nr:acyl-CoA dehydrogenase NM domain-like protein [Corynespora cassiicola Philippines]